MADPIGIVGFLCEAIAERTAGDENATDYTIILNDPTSFALICLEEQAIYKVTVEEARLVPSGPAPEETT